MLGRIKLMEYIINGNDEKPVSKEYIQITTCEGATPFNKDVQVGRDSIDLRTGNSGYRIKRNYEYISTLDENIRDCFEEFTISTEEGLIIEPGETVVVGSAERIKLAGPFFGEVMGRTRFARMGLSIHCTAPKFQGYSDAIVVFQLTNNNLVPLKVFPYQTIAQLVIQKVEGYPPNLEGKYTNEQTPMLPFIDDDELCSYNPQDLARIRRNKTKIAKNKNSNGEINHFFGIQKSILILIIVLDCAILGMAVTSCFVQGNTLMISVITAILTTVSGVLSFINKRA